MWKREREGDDSESGKDGARGDPGEAASAPVVSTLSPPFSPSSAASPHSDRSPSKAPTSFGAYLWNEVGVVLFFRFFFELRKVCGALLRIAAASPEGAEAPCLSSSPDAQALLRSFERNLQVAWDVGKRHLPSGERQRQDPVVRRYLRRLVVGLRGAAGRAAADVPTTCRRLQRFLDDEGFPAEERGELSEILSAYRQAREPGGYAYHVRASMQLPSLPRYEGDKRLEEGPGRPRAGFAVVLPAPHPNANVNTRVQLIEPRKKRPPLDEYRIFSHPKKAATYGVEDFLVDEELTYRALVVLGHHLDTFGSLVRLSPYARFLLWGLLGCDDDAFEGMHGRPAATPELRAGLARLRRTLAGRQAIFEKTRTAAREAALDIGWCAISAQWRDGVLSALSAVREGGWYGLGEVPRQGGRGVFPNFAANALVCELAMGVLARVAGADVGLAARAALLPFLQGVGPALGPDELAGRRRAADKAAREGWRRLQRLLAAEKKAAAASPHRRFDFVCASMVVPLQCLAELLELCSLAYFSKAGAEAFSRGLLGAAWTCEEDLIQFLIETEAMNPGIVAVVALPRLCRNLIAGIQTMLEDRLFSYVLAMRRKVEHCPEVCLNRRNYSYWKALATISEDDEDHSDSFFLVEVEALESAPPLERLRTERYWTEAFLEKPPRVWDEDIQDLLEEEEVYKSVYPAQPRNDD